MEDSPASMLLIDAGVVGTCGELCQLLEQKVHSQLAGVVCNQKDNLMDRAGKRHEEIL